MDIPKDKLGLHSEAMIDVVNLKCESVLIGLLLSESGFFPAYHMNKENWITDALLFIEGPISWFMEYSVEQQVPLDIYKLQRGEDGSINLEFASSPDAGSEKVSVLYGDVIVLGDSVTTVYYQPGIEHETDAFYKYMEELYEKAASSTKDLSTAEQMIYSQYEVPKSSERVLIYSK